MKKMESISLTRLSNLEFGQLIKNTLNELANKNAVTITDEVLTNYLNILEAKSNEYDKGLKQIAKSDETAKIVDADKQRDNAITALQRILSVFEFSENTNEQEAFTSLTNLFTIYKGIQNWNFIEETNGIDSLLSDLNGSKYNPHLVTLQMLPFVERIKSTNEQFKLLFSGRTQEKASKEVYDVKQLRQEANKVYNDMANYVLSLSKALDSDQYNRSLNILNTTRKYFSDLIARHNSKADAKSTEGTLSN